MAHFYIKQLDGTLKDVIYMFMLPTYFLMPEKILSKAGAELNSINRNPYQLFRDRRSLDIIAGDKFAELVIDGMAYLIWPYIARDFDLHPNMEVYSGYHPAWILAHSPMIWQDGLTDEKLIPTTKDLYEKRPNEHFGILPYEEVSGLLGYIYPSSLEKSGFSNAIASAKDNPCHEDFSEFYSNAKTDFYRHWYHSRAARKTCSLEEVQETYALDHDGAEWDLPDESSNLEKDVTLSVYADNFLNSLSDNDREILGLRLKEYSMQEIADKLGYKTHSAIQKRIRKIGLAYQKYAGEDLGFH